MNWSEEFGASIADLLYKILLAEEFKFSHTKIRSIFKIFNQKYPSFIPTLKARRSEFDISKSICRLMTPIVKMSLVRKTYCQRTPGQVDGQFKKQQSLFLKNQFETIACGSDTEMEELDDHAAWKFPEHHCMLCQNAAEDAGPFGIIAYISKSCEFRNVPFSDEYWF